LFAVGRTEPVTGVVAADKDQDAAVLEVPTGTRHALALVDEFNLREGESVLAIGAPQGLELSLTNGIISAFRNSEEKFLIQNTAPIAPGSSGGPLLDSRGRVIGATTSLLVDTPGVYFSIGVRTVKRLLKDSSTMSRTFAGTTDTSSVKASPNLRVACINRRAAKWESHRLRRPAVVLHWSEHGVDIVPVAGKPRGNRKTLTSTEARSQEESLRFTLFATVLVASGLWITA